MTKHRSPNILSLGDTARVKGRYGDQTVTIVGFDRGLVEFEKSDGVRGKRPFSELRRVG